MQSLPITVAIGSTVVRVHNFYTHSIHDKNVKTPTYTKYTHTNDCTYLCMITGLTNDDPAIVASWGGVFWLQHPGLFVQFIHDIPELLVVT